MQLPWPVQGWALQWYWGITTLFVGLTFVIFAWQLIGRIFAFNGETGKRPATTLLANKALVKEIFLDMQPTNPLFNYKQWPGAGALVVVILVLFLVAGLWQGGRALGPERHADVVLLKESTYKNGEKLEYRVHYGFITAGEAVLRVNDRYRRVDDKICYQVEATGRSNGTFDRIVRIRNTWGSFIDTGRLQPMWSYRSIEENRYRLKEDVSYDYGRRLAKVEIKGKRDTVFRVPSSVQDIVSGYYLLRQVDYSRLTQNEVVEIDAFFDKVLYKFKVRYVGKETVKTKWGRIRAILVSPIMPENSLFDGENAIRLWMSDDSNRVPIKVSAELFVGAVEIDLKGYSGTRTKLGQ